MRTSLAQLLLLQPVLLDSAIIHGPGGSSSWGCSQVGDSLVSAVRGDKTGKGTVFIQGHLLVSLKVLRAATS